MVRCCESGWMKGEGGDIVLLKRERKVLYLY